MCIRDSHSAVGLDVKRGAVATPGEAAGDLVVDAVEPRSLHGRTTDAVACAVGIPVRTTDQTDDKPARGEGAWSQHRIASCSACAGRCAAEFGQVPEASC